MDLFWQKIEEAIALATEIPIERRDEWLAEFCAGDAKLKAEIESLLAFENESERFLEKAVSPYATLIFNDGETDVAGKQFGVYQIAREIGRGGMGAVFLAERTDGEFEQQVALKIIRQTVVDAETENRFRRERQILAALNHPNIAKLLDGGVSELGEPFLAMEYVDGRPLTDFTRVNELSITECLRLFIKICAAVSFAHQNLIVHRDIKPSNILVTENGEPKLLDFGLAKALDFETAATQTATAFRAMTPAYASPEQMRGEIITTASDIYSLGIVLYELLTGTRPFDFQSNNLEEMRRVISTDEPLRPSTYLQRLSPDERHGKKPNLLKGDLDNIVLTALRKEPARRYKSVGELSDDIERYLKGLPVKARPNTFKYRSEKFFKRHKVGVLATSLILLSLIGGIIVSVRQTRIARREKNKAEAVNGFLLNLLGASNPELDTSRREGRDTTVKEVLDTAAERLADEDLSNQPEVKAELQRIVGISYLAQGQYNAAEKNLDAAVQSQIETYGEDSPEVLQTLVAVADLWISKGEYAKADKFYRQRISILRAAAGKGSISADDFFTALYNFALLRRAQGDSKEAENLLREALTLRPQMSSEMKNSLGLTESVLALTLTDQGNFDEAETIVRAKLAAIRGQTNSETSELCGNLTMFGSVLMEKGIYDEAQQNLLEAETLYRKIYRDTYLPLGDNLRLQAQILYLQNRLPEAEAKINEALAIYEKATSREYINFPTALIVQGLIDSHTDRMMEGEKILREAVQLRAENMPPEHFLNALAKGALGENLMLQKRFAEAELLLRESLDSLQKSQGFDNPRTVIARQRLARLTESRK